ncbi:MAG TPA: N-acetyltransferase [Sphaerochaeta sp.]|nr:N-acetyltransferase [Sphaerochaeta sp.]
MTGIRAIGEQDLSAICSLIRQLASDLGEVFDVDQMHYLLKYQAMQRYPDIYHNSVYCIDDEVVGFISLVLYRSFFHKRGTALVNELVVSREYRNQKIGKALIDHAMAVAQELGFDEIEVGVMKENKGALAFYRHNGFDEEYLLLGREFTD